MRIGLHGGEYPYVVPVSFGAEMAGGRLAVYFHCARQGMKLDLLEKDPRACVEGDIFLGVETTEHGITTRYESVIGFGTCEIVEDEEEIAHGLRVLTAHYGYGDYPLDRCGGMAPPLLVRRYIERCRIDAPYAFVVATESPPRRGCPDTTRTLFMVFSNLP